MIALSIRQPWAWLIVNGHKDIENRGWATARSGRILVHAGKGMTRDEYESAVDTIDYIKLANQIALPSFEALERGGIVGAVDLTGCVDAHDRGRGGGSESPWFFGRYGFVLRNGQPLPFRPFKGQLGFFDVPDVGPDSNGGDMK